MGKIESRGAIVHLKGGSKGGCLHISGILSLLSTLTHASMHILFHDFYATPYFSTPRTFNLCYHTAFAYH